MENKSKQPEGVAKKEDKLSQTTTVTEPTGANGGTEVMEGKVAPDTGATPISTPPH